MIKAVVCVLHKEVVASTTCAHCYGCHGFNNLRSLPWLPWLQQLVLTLTTTQASGISGNVTTRFGKINQRHSDSPWVCVGSHIACDCGCGQFFGGHGAGVVSHTQVVLWVGLVGVVSIVQFFSAKMETRGKGILHKIVSLIIS